MGVGKILENFIEERDDLFRIYFFGSSLVEVRFTMLYFPFFIIIYVFIYCNRNS